MAETWVLMRIGRRGEFRYDYFGLAHGKLFSKQIKAEGPWLAAFSCVCVLAAAFTFGRLDQQIEIVPSHTPLASFPLDLDTWHGKIGSVEQDVVQFLNFSDYWIADYSRAEDTRPVNFYIAYYASQRMKTQIHSPSLCIPGGGWQIENSRVETVR